MKKIILFIILFSSMFCYALEFPHVDVYRFKMKYNFLNYYHQIGKILFVVKPDRCYEFKMKLKKEQYVFMFKGEKQFTTSIIEPSGYEYEKIDSDIFNNESIRFENIMETNVYIIKICSTKHNLIEMLYGTY